MSASGSEDEDLKKALEISLAQSSPAAEDITSRNARRPAVSTASSFLNDRKTMEAERLARQGKRDRSVSPPVVARKAPKLDIDTTELASGAQLRMFSSRVQNDQKHRKSAVANASNQNLQNTTAVPSTSHEASGLSTYTDTRHGSIKYPNGVVKKTWAFGFDRTGDDIKLEEVLEANTLKTALLSAFQWDMDWVLAKLKTPLRGGKTKCIFVMQAKEAELRQQMLEETEPARAYLKLIFPPMEGQTHCMHSKLMLLFHPEKLRIAIPTANLLNFDWGETGQMENSVFMIDLPRLPANPSTPPQTERDLPPFGQELLLFLRASGLGPDVQTGVLGFDFTATRTMAFIHSIGGITHGSGAHHTGLPGLARAVRTLKHQTTPNLQLDFAASSIGSLNDDFLRSVHSAARGIDPLAASAAAASKAKSSFFDKKTAPKPEQRLQESIGIRQKMRIYFPTKETVRASRAGAAGTICLSRKWFESMTFPRSCFRDYVSTRAGLLSHNKILYARGKALGEASKAGDKAEGEGEGGQDVAWAYVGSANMSESAWGKVVLDKKTKEWRVNCRNWECGVLLPVVVPAKSSQGAQLPAKLEAPERDPDETASEDEEKPAPKKRATPARIAGKAITNGKSKAKVKHDDSETESEDETAAAAPLSDRVVASPVVGMDVFDSRVKPPFELPGKAYEGKEPWYFME